MSLSCLCRTIHQMPVRLQPPSSLRSKSMPMQHGLPTRRSHPSGVLRCATARRPKPLARLYSGRAHAYTPGPSKFGRYPLMTPDMAMTTYPDPLPVPASIPRPPYVPSNFFTAPWGEHDQPSFQEGRVQVDEGKRDSVERVQALLQVGGMAAEILQMVERKIRVRIFKAV